MRPRHPGFTLLELLVATGLLIVSVLFILSSIPTSARSLRNAELLQAQTAYAAEVVNATRTNVPPTFNTSPTVNPSPLTNSFAVTLAGVPCQVTRTLTQLGAQGPYSLDEVVVQVQRIDQNVEPVQIFTRLTVVQPPATSGGGP